MMHPEIKKQREAMAEERRWWTELAAIAETGDVAWFYARYADYLESRRVISKQREILRTMALRVVEQLIPEE